MITKLEQVSDQRLTWPEDKPRTSQRQRSPFTSKSIDVESRNVRDEMHRWGIENFVISRNVLRMYAGDPAVAVWWADPADGSIRVLACDKWETMGENMRALYRTLDAMRALERWGAYTAEQAAEGAKLKALPPPEGADWRKVLGSISALKPQEQLDLNRANYRRMQREAAGNEDRMRVLNLAMEACERELTEQGAR